jgi:hypothetical protein
MVWSFETDSTAFVMASLRVSSGKKATSGQVKRWPQLASSVRFGIESAEQVKGEASTGGGESRYSTSDKGGNGRMEEE